MSLIEITPDAFGIECDLVYATERNFTGKAIYGRPGCYLHADTAALLRVAVDLAGALGFRLRILDAFRPAEAQWKLWEHLPDPMYLADPRRGSPHSMGAAIDLTLVDAVSGGALEMGTGFDDMRPLSWHGSTAIPAAAQRNRALLLGIMTAAGFDFYRNEWWHYQLFSPRGRYPVLSDSVLAKPMMEITEGPTPAPWPSCHLHQRLPWTAELKSAADGCGVWRPGASTLITQRF